MISSLELIFIIAAILSLNKSLCICGCARAEYEINGECCPMCAPGSRVYRHCTEFTSVTCMPCTDSTYTDEPNGLSSCISCTVCDAGQGLRVTAACTRMSDTVCEPLEGFYCTDKYMGMCRHAEEHTKCSPGQYIKQKGTAVKDTECAVCADGTYSNGSLQTCKQHAQCADLGLEEITPGTNSFDVECGSKTPVAVIAGTSAFVALVLAIAGALGILNKKRHKNSPPSELPLTTAEKARLSDHQANFYKERDISTIRTNRTPMSKFNHPGLVASPVQNDCGKQLYDQQEHVLTHTAYDVT